MHRSSFVCVTSFLLLLAAQSVRSETPKSLEESFRAALVRSETVAIQTELIAQAEERYRQASGAVFPTVAASASQTWQDPGGSTVSSPGVQPLVKLNLTQPLFRGFREFATIRSATSQRETQQELRRQAASSLFLDVAQNYFTILSLEQDLHNVDSELQLYSKRMKDLNERRKIGRSRLSEVLSTESVMTVLKAQQEQIRGQVSSAREAYAFLAGLPRDTALAGKESGFLGSLLPLPNVLASLDERPDVRAEMRRAEVSSANVDVARGGHLPSADLNGNYYLARYGTSQNANWDVQLALSMPIFAGGVVQSRVREAASAERQSAQSLTRVQRLAEQEIRTLYGALEADRAQYDALRKATALSERNYFEQLKDYSLGLVTNLDVLQALTAYEESLRSLDRLRFAAELDYWKLQVAGARSPTLPQDFKRPE